MGLNLVHLGRNLWPLLFIGGTGHLFLQHNLTEWFARKCRHVENRDSKILPSSVLRILYLPSFILNLNQRDRSNYENAVECQFTLIRWLALLTLGDVVQVSLSTERIGRWPHWSWMEFLFLFILSKNVAIQFTGVGFGTRLSKLDCLINQVLDFAINASKFFLVSQILFHEVSR